MDDLESLHFEPKLLESELFGHEHHAPARSGKPDGYGRLLVQCPALANELLRRLAVGPFDPASKASTATPKSWQRLAIPPGWPYLAEGGEIMDTQNKARTTEELKQKLEQQVEAARKRLDELKRDIGSLHEQDRQALQEKREEIHRRVEAQKERGRQLRTGFEQWGREKVGHTKEAVASWRQQSEIHKLRSRADRAEEYAVGAIVAAALDADEAEEAVLDAISARMDAEAASPQ